MQAIGVVYELVTIPYISPCAYSLARPILVGLYSDGLIFGWAYIRMGLYSDGLIFGSAYIRIGLYSDRLIFGWAYIRMGLYSDGPIFGWAYIRMGLYSDRLIFGSAYIRIGLYSDGLIFGWACIRIGLYSDGLIFGRLLFLYTFVCFDAVSFPVLEHFWISQVAQILYLLLRDGKIIERICGRILGDKRPAPELPCKYILYGKKRTEKL